MIGRLEGTHPTLMEIIRLLLWKQEEMRRVPCDIITALLEMRHGCPQKRGTTDRIRKQVRARDLRIDVFRTGAPLDLLRDELTHVTTPHHLPCTLPSKEEHILDVKDAIRREPLEKHGKVVERH